MSREKNFSEMTMLDKDVDLTEEEYGGSAANRIIDDEVHEPEKEESPEQGVDTEPETTDTEEGKPSEEEVDTETETTSPVDDLDELFNRNKLYTQFSSPREVLERIPETNKYITRLEQEKAEMKRRLEELENLPKTATSRHEDVDPEALLSDPGNTLAGLGFVRGQDVERRLEAFMQAQQAEKEAANAENFVKRTRDFNNYREGISKVFRDKPGLLKGLPVDQALEIAYTMAKANSTPSREQVERSDQDKKDRAKTGGGSSRGSKTGGLPDNRAELTSAQAAKMSLKELEEYYG